MTLIVRHMKRSRVDLKASVLGDNVAVPILAVDRGRGGPWNINGVITNRDADTDQYNIAVKVGVLKGHTPETSLTCVLSDYWRKLNM